MSEKPLEMWASFNLENDACQMGFTAKAAAVAHLGSSWGEALRYEHALPDDLGDLFDIEDLLEKMAQFFEECGVIGDHEQGLLDVSIEQRELLREKLTEATRAWASAISLPIWAIREREQINASADEPDSVAP